MCRTWYEVGQEVGMKLVIKMAKISGTQLFMAIDDLFADGYRMFPFIRTVIAEGAPINF